MQLVAATALHRLGWMYEKNEKKWVKNVSDGVYYIFIPEKWQNQQVAEINHSNIEHEPPLTYKQIENLWLGPHLQLLQKINK